MSDGQRLFADDFAGIYASARCSSTRPVNPSRSMARLTGKGGGDPMGPWGRPAAKPSVGADLIAAVRALRPAGAAALSRLRGAAPRPQ